MARRPKKVRYFHVAAAVAGLAAVLSLHIPGEAFLGKPALKLITAAWLVIPPVWFFFELHWVRERHPEELDRLKESQEAATKVWAGVAAALALLYL